MLVLAYNFAEPKSYDSIVIGIGNRHLAPLNPRFLSIVNKFFDGGREGAHPLRVEAPLVGPGAPNILSKADELGLPLHISWSCLRDGDGPCGGCTKCHYRHHVYAEEDAA